MGFFKYRWLVLVLIFSLHLNAQENKIPKVGLCLSGGGAKGLAHIGLLKLIDSLKIKIDYITGTSMGSIVGGLYAAGYTGIQIDSIAHSIDWDIVLSQYVPMNEIYIDEKDEYGRYIGEIPIKNGKVQVTGFIEGQELLCILMRLTKHVNQIIDFNKLPIPFKCMAIDIVSVKPIVMDRGSLAIALRSSMSIPTVFKPVKVDGKLLVDGGLMVNFPVQQLKEMGADIIIGSYTGGRLMAENEMNTFDKLLVQSSSFYGINKSRDDISLCSIFNNLTDSMKQYGAGDFKKANQIIATGNIISYNILPQLVKLADKQRELGTVYEKNEVMQSSSFLKVEDIIIEPAYSKKMNKFIMNRVTFNPGDSINFKDLEKTVEKIYGTRNFIKVYDILEPQKNGNYIVKLKIEQDVKFRIKGAVHYDNESGAGFIVNLTARNWLGKGSRLVATVDLAENAKLRIHYRKYIAQSNLSFNTEFLREMSFLQFRDGKGVVSASGSYKDLYRSFNIGFNYNIAKSISLYVGAIGEIDRLTPRFNTDINYAMGAQTYRTKHITAYTSGILGQFRFNNFNRFVFPNKGTDFFVGNRLVLIPLEKYESSVITVDSSYKEREKFYSDSSLYTPYNIISLKFTNLLPISKRFSIFTNFNMGFTYFNAVKFDTSIFSIKHNRYYSNNGNDYKSTPINDYFFIGGVDGRSGQNFSSLWGLNERELIEKNFATLRLGIQCEVLHNLFITPAITYFYSSSSPKGFFKYIGKPKTNYESYEGLVPISVDQYGYKYYEYYHALITYGLNIGYKSPIGPISFNISKSEADKRWRAYISIGYKF